MTQTEEEILIEQVKNGDELAFRKLYELHRSTVRRLAFRMLESDADAEDATQEVFLKVWKCISSFRGECRLLTWLWQITSNHCLCTIRARQTQIRFATMHDSILNLDATELIAICRWLKPDQSPLTTLINNQQIDSVTTTLKALPVRYREVLTKRLNGCTESDISAATGWSIPQIRGYYNRARLMLVNALSKTEGRP